MNDIDKAIEYYHDHNGDTIGFNRIIVEIYNKITESSKSINPLSEMIDTADLIIQRLDEESIYEKNIINDIIYRCLNAHVMNEWYNFGFGTSIIRKEFTDIINIRLVTSYAETQKNRYKIRDKEYSTLHHNYYVIENKINDRLKLRYSDKDRNKIINHISILMYSLKLISKYHCKLQYDLIQSVVKDFGTKQLY